MSKYCFRFKLAWQCVLAAVACVSVLLPLGSCNSVDEPEQTIDYYLSIESRVVIKSYGGIAPPPKENTIGIAVDRMRSRLRMAYPEPDLKGDDYAVLVACDDVYSEYLQSNFKTNIECVVILYRVRKSGIVVKKSTPIKAYHF